MTTHEYESYLHTKLINEFKERFYEKTGRVPIVLIREDSSIPRVSLEELKQIINKFIPVETGILDIETKIRKRPVVELRYMYMQIAKFWGHTLASIGLSLGGRDHTTVLHGVEQFHILYAQDENFQMLYNNIIIHIKKYHSNVYTVLQHTEEEGVDSEPVLHSMAL